MIEIRVTELSVPPRVPESSVFGTFTCRSWEWYISPTPLGTRCETTARHAITPLRLKTSTQSLSRTPIVFASSTESQMTGPPRKSVSIVRLSWNSEWIDHFECGESQRTCTSARPSSPENCSPTWRRTSIGGR